MRGFIILFLSVGNLSPRTSHPCDRPCGGEAKVCYFELTARVQQVGQPDAPTADGRARSVLTYNKQLPGPLLVVCEDDIVRVKLFNEIQDGPVTNSDGSPNSTTLHFHGIRELGLYKDMDYIYPKPGFGPWSDGVPYVNQCPISGGDETVWESFTYQFKAGNISPGDFNAPPGTYWYHSHEGAQRTNGLQGGLIIKDKISPRPHVRDNPVRQTIILQEWYESPVCQVPVSILVNGKGRVPEKKFVCDDDEEDAKYLKGHGGHFAKKDYIPSENDVKTNYEVFKVRPGKPYRFRILGLIGQNFPIRFSIDDHTFTAIAADSLYIKPIRNLTNLWIAAGERYDIQLKPKSRPDWDSQREAFKIRLIGFGDITDKTTALCSIAWLKYPGQVIDFNYTTPHDCSDFDLLTPSDYPPPQRTLNPPGISYKDWSQRLQFPDWRDLSAVGSIYPVDFRSSFKNDTSNVHSTNFIKFYPSNTFNNIRSTFPRVPYLLQSENKSEHCDNANKESKSRKNNPRNGYSPYSKLF